MFETIRRAMLFSLGAAAISAERIRHMIDEMIAHGEVTTEEGKRLYEEVMSRAEEERHRTSERIRVQVMDILKDVGVADRTQIAMLESRIQTLERQVETLSASVSKPEAVDG